MKKKISSKEIMLIIIIIVIILAIVIPLIINKKDKESTKEENAVENLLIENLKTYNNKYEKDIWCLDNSKTDCMESGELFIDFSSDMGFYTDYKPLTSINSNIDLGDCLLMDTESLSIVKGTNGEYNYNARIICSKDFQDKEYNIAETEDLNNQNIYYRSGE